VQTTAEAAPLTNLGEHLKRGLAICVFEVLSPQPEAMHAQQQVALGVRDERDLFEQIA
jgi:hypothetical protein